MNLAVVGRVGNGKQPAVHLPVSGKVLTAEVPRRQKTKGVTIVSHGSIKSFVFEPVFSSYPFPENSMRLVLINSLYISCKYYAKLQHIVGTEKYLNFNRIRSN